ncbi:MULTISPECIES: hybrid sensor histidine kinase/response regulator [Pseudomonas]|uniref:hybrid sensor histidine kinase/response regulator n=1 Tax=Pseudomonas TaxID=286 RepID=UPI00123C1038|nr:MULTISPECIES: hybrid sensor histidine kinase/response regulator [Pseudomonas]QIB51719.1 response regulator [Pseudomonas sp. OIL-1]
MQATDTPVSPPALDEPALLAQQRRFAALRFSPQFEPAFREYLHGKMCGRVGIVGFSSISFMLLFMWVDVAYLPEVIHRYTVPIRGAALLLIAATLWYANRPGRVAPSRAFIAATVCYVSVGLMVVLVIASSRLTVVPVPVTHDGLYLVLLSGFFLLGLPMRHAVIGSWFIVAAYLFAEYWVGASRYLIISGALFLGCFAAMGSLGAYVYEYMMRRAYLNERLLDAARKRAERESQSKTRFLATASHDLRQPLHAMSLFIQHLDERVKEPEARITVRRLADSTHLLQAMLNSLLDISRLSVGMVKPQLRSINLQPWLQQLLGTLESSAQERGVTLKLSCPRYCAVSADSLLLERLMRNYLNNALVHAQATDVWIEVTRCGERTRLAVVDNGCGLTEEEQERIFEEFTQLRNPARTLEKGVGLGLSICRQLLHLLEYPSGVESTPGQGSRFWLEVPAADWVADSQVAPMPDGQLLNGLIAVVENDEINRLATETLLRQWGCSVISYETAEQALLGLQKTTVDLLLSDFRLEGSMDGLELIRELRSQRIHAGAAALITADTSEELLIEARQADVAVIYKPVLPARLRRTVQRLLPLASADVL